MKDDKKFAVGDDVIYVGKTYTFPGRVSAVTDDGQVVVTATGDLATGHYRGMKHIYGPSQLAHVNPIPEPTGRPCGACRGSGLTVEPFMSDATACRKCGGKGFISDDAG